MNLSDIQPGQKVRVIGLSAEHAICRRLLDIGMTENTEIECIGQCPFGDPKAFLIRGAVIAIREEDAQKVSVKWD